jgi:hypothetical protein
MNRTPPAVIAALLSLTAFALIATIYIKSK